MSSLLCYFVRASAIWLLIRARDNSCVLCDVTRDMLSLGIKIMVHQLTVSTESCRQILTVAILLCDDFPVWLIIFINVLSVSNFLK